MASNKPPLTQKGGDAVRPKGESKCSIHGNREIMLCCLDCDQLLCVTCSISTHLGHRQEELINMIPEKKSSLQHFINDAESIKLIELESEISLVQSMLVGNEEHCKRFREFQELLSSSARQVILNKDLLQKYKKELENRFGTLLERAEECKVILRSGTPVQVCDAANDFAVGDPKFPDEVILFKIDIGPITSMPTESQDENGKATAYPETSNNGACSKDTENQQQSENVISNVMKKQDDDFLKNPELLLLFNSTIECYTVHPMAFGVWLRAYRSKELLLVDIRGHPKRRIKTARTITCTSTSPTTNNIWFGCAGDLSIYEVSQDSKLPVKRVTVDSEIIGLCITAKEQVVVLSDINLVIFTPNGGVLASLLLGVAMTNIHISLKAGTISQCPITKNLAINVRYEEEEEDGIWLGKLMVYDESLQLKFDYSGRGDHLPWKSVYDSRGNIVVLSAGAVERRIQVLNSAGEYVRTIYVGGSMDMVGIGFRLDRLWVSILEENSKRFARNTKSSIYTIEYFKSK